MGILRIIPKVSIQAPSTPAQVFTLSEWNDLITNGGYFHEYGYKAGGANYKSLANRVSRYGQISPLRNGDPPRFYPVDLSPSYNWGVLTIRLNMEIDPSTGNSEIFTISLLRDGAEQKIRDFHNSLGAGFPLGSYPLVTGTDVVRLIFKLDRSVMPARNTIERAYIKIERSILNGPAIGQGLVSLFHLDLFKKCL